MPTESTCGREDAFGGTKCGQFLSFSHLFTMQRLAKEYADSGLGKQKMLLSGRPGASASYSKCSLSPGCLLRVHGGNLLEKRINAASGLESRVHRGMAFPIRVHHQNPRPFLPLLHHIRQVVPVIFGQGGTKDDQVKCIPAQSLLHLLATRGPGHVVPRLLDNNRLCSKDFRVALTVENLEFERGFRGICHSESGRPSFPAWPSRYQPPRGSENVTEDQ